MIVTSLYVSLILPPSISFSHSNQRIFLELQSGHTLLNLQHLHPCSLDEAPNPGHGLSNQVLSGPPAHPDPSLFPPLPSSLCAVMSHFLGPQGLCPHCPLCLPAPPPRPCSQHLLILGSNVTFLRSLPLNIFSGLFLLNLPQFTFISDLWDYLIDVCVPSSNPASPLRVQA